VAYEGEDTAAEPETGSTGTPDKATVGGHSAAAGSGQADSDPDHQADSDPAEGGCDHAGTGSGPADDGTGAGVPDAADEVGEDSGAAVA
jgi:hypothetical protein